MSILSRFAVKAAKELAERDAKPLAAKRVARQPRAVPVYHGSPEKFDRLDPNRSRAGLGVYVTPNRQFAETFTRGSGNILQGDLRPQAVTDFRKYGAFPSSRAIPGIARKMGADPSALAEVYKSLAKQQGDVHMFSLLENAGVDLPDKNAWRFMDWGEGSPEEAYVFRDPDMFAQRKARGGLAVKRRRK